MPNHHPFQHPSGQMLFAFPSFPNAFLTFVFSCLTFLWLENVEDFKADRIAWGKKNHKREQLALSNEEDREQKNNYSTNI